MRYSGHVSSEELEQATLLISGDERLDNLRFLIADWSDSSNSETMLSEDEIRRNVVFVGTLAMSNPNVMLAVVLNPDNSHRWEMANSMEKFSESIPWDVKCFDTLKEAKSWLNIE